MLLIPAGPHRNYIFGLSVNVITATTEVTHSKGKESAAYVLLHRLISDCTFWYIPPAVQQTGSKMLVKLSLTDPLANLLEKCHNGPFAII